MLWSLIKVILFVVAIAGLSLAAGSMSDSEELMRITVAGWEFTLGALQISIVLLCFAAVVWGSLKVIGLVAATIRFLNGDETAISRYFDRNRERKGYRALSEGLMALASGDANLALARAQAAEKLLGQPELTTLLVAQAAEKSGDTSRATRAYKALLSDQKTRFVGVHGLLKQKLAEGDRLTALKLAEKAFELRPKHQETQDLLLKLQSDAGDWSGARATLGAKLKTGALPKDVYRRRDAVLALQEARIVISDSATIVAREAAIEANKLSPDLIPAAVLAARTYAENGDKKNAVRVIKKAWEVQPHPDLAGALAAMELDETPQERLKRFKVLTTLHPGSDETMMLLAELQIAAEDFPAARRALGDVAIRHPTQRSLALLAVIGRGEGADDPTVRDLISQALAAPRGPQWCCDGCQTIQASWRPICDNCGGFDTLSWREPPATSVSSPAFAALIPLIARSDSVTAKTTSVAEAPSLDEIARRAN